jgi:SAM-dependent methyltransferase
MKPDFGSIASDYRGYRRPFPSELFQRLLRFGVGSAGQLVLDVGSGTQLLGAALRQRGCHVIASDVSQALLAASPDTGASQVVARSEHLPFADGRFDAVTAAQCWHWFNRRLAPREIHRVLRPGGLIAVFYQMYVPLPGTIAEATEHLILRYHPGWRHANSAGISGQVLRDMQSHRFIDIESFSFDVIESFSHEQWRGFIRTTSAVGASMPPDRLAAFDRDHGVLLRDWPEALQIPHRIFTAIARKPFSRLESGGTGVSPLT